MEIKFTVPGPPKGQRDVAFTSHMKKARAKIFFACAETGRELPARAPRRPRICKVNGRSVAYTPKETIEYENLIRASYTAGSKAKFERSLPLEISILALFPIPKYVSRKTKELMLNGRLFPTKKPDADNIIKVILDALNGLAYRDDVQICRVYFEKMYAEIPETKVLIKNYEVD